MTLPHLLPALITPFDASGEPDLEAHAHNLNQLWDSGIRGFLVAGSTGEGPYLEPGERFQLIKTARAQLTGAYVACGVAAETVRQALSMISEAVGGGADSAMVMTPTTLTRNRMSDVEGYYQAVADASPIPLFLYSVPSVTAFELPEPLVVSLSQHSNIVGMKDSAGDPVRMQRLAGEVDASFRLFTGSTQAVMLAITAGAYGAITASTNYLPDLLLELVRTAGEHPIKARELQQRVSAISTKVESLGIPGVNAAAGMSGLRPGLTRPPLAVLGETDQGLIAQLMRST